MVQFKDEEANHETAPSKSLASIQASVGWRLPEVKLASWDPENEKQWNVSTTSSCSGTGLRFEWLAHIDTLFDPSEWW